MKIHLFRVSYSELSLSSSFLQRVSCQMLKGMTTKQKRCSVGHQFFFAIISRAWLMVSLRPQTPLEPNLWPRQLHTHSVLQGMYRRRFASPLAANDFSFFFFFFPLTGIYAQVSTRTLNIIKPTTPFVSPPEDVRVFTVKCAINPRPFRLLAAHTSISHPGMPHSF